MSHSLQYYKEMGRLDARVKEIPQESLYEQYEAMFMQALSLKATVKKNVNVLQHMAGYFKKELSKDEKQETREGTVEHWGRSADNPLGGWYGLKKNFRGRFGMYIPPLMEALGLAEVTHEKRGNKMKAK